MPIYEVKAPDGSILEIQGPEGASDAQLINTAASYYRQQEFARQQPVEEVAPKPQERTWGEALVTDPFASITSGLGSLAQIPGQVGQLAGMYTPEESRTGLQGIGKQMEEAGQAMKSEELKRREQARAQKVAAETGIAGEAMTAIKETISDPALFTSFMFEQIPNLFGSMGGGMLTKAGVKLALRGATEQALEKAAVRGAVGTGAAMQGADIGSETYEQLYTKLKADGYSNEQANQIALDKARVAAIEAAGISLGTAFLPGGTTIERAIVGRGLPRTGGFVKGLIGEGLSEGVEEGGGKFVSNVQQAEVYPEMDIYKGVGEAAGMGALMGGAFGGAGGISLRGQPTNIPPAEIPPNILPPTEGVPPAEGEGPGIRGIEETNPPIGVPPVEEEPPVTEAPPVEPTPPVEPPVVETPPTEPPVVETPPVEPTPPVQPPVVETPPVEPPEVEPGSIYHPFEIAMQSGNQEEINKINEVGKLKGINFNFNEDGRINLNQSKVDWDVLKKLKTGQKVLDHIRDYVPLDTREIIDRITPFVKHIPIRVSNAASGYEGVHWLRGRGDNALHNIELFTKSRSGNSFETITHELIHGATVRNYFQGFDYNKHSGRMGDKRFAKASNELDELANYLVDNHYKDVPFFSYYKKRGQSDSDYKSSIARELLSWGTTNRETQERLKQIKLPSGKSVWTKFVETLRNLLQIPANETNALTRILELQDKLIGGTQAKPYVKPRAKRGTPKGVMDAAANITRTPEFRKWFGDSKVVNQDGEPMVVFHGTTKDFPSFDQDKVKNGKLGAGFYFSANPNLASNYATSKGGNVIPAFIRMENPLVADTAEDAVKILQDRGVWINEEEFVGVHPSEMTKILRQAGFDGMQFGSVYVVTEPNQIKSIFNERPTEAPEMDAARQQPWSERESPDAWGREDALRGIYNRMQSAYDESFSPEEAYQAAYESASNAEKYILRELKKDDFLGFDYPHQAIRAIAEDAGAYDLSPGLKTAISRVGNKVFAQPKEEPVGDASIAPRTKATGGAAPKATWELRPLEAETSRSRYLKNKIYEYVDKFVDLKDIIKAINTSTKENAKKLDETWNAYRRETLYHNRVAWMTNQFLKNDLKPLAEDMVKRNVSEEELNNYLLARHAEDYNKRINERNTATELQDRGSGVHTMIARAYMNGANAQQIQAIRDLFAKNRIEINSNENALLKDLARMSDAKRNNLNEVAKRIDKIVKETQKISVAGGLEKQSTIDFWRDMYPNYVPLKRSPEELDFVEKNYGTGRGFSTKSGFGRAATGSLKTVDNIMANLILQRDMAIVRSEKGRIGRALYAMALQNPNPGFWLPVNPEAAAISKANDLYMEIAKTKESLQRKIKKVDADIANGKDMDPADLAEIDQIRRQLSKDEARHAELAAKAEQVKKAIVEELGKFEGSHGLPADAINNLIREPQGAWYNPSTKQVEYRTNAYLRSSPNVLAVPVDGETRYIFFNPGDERAKRLINSIKSADVEQIGEITAAVGKATRWIAKVNTQYNPFFGIVNMLRDVQGAQFNLSSTPLAGKQMAVNKNIPGSMATIYRSLRAERAGGEATGPYAADWAEFQRLGGPTGIKDMMAREQDKLTVLGEEISKLQEGAAKKLGRRGVNAVFDLMSDFNDVMENSVRLSAFVEAKKKFEAQGFKKDVAADKAAELAKNLTVNFNRKGAKSQMVNSWFAFFNAAVQGSARLAETMTGPAGKKIAASLVMLGVIQQLMLASAGFDDEDPPEFVRSKSLIIPTQGGKYISIPMPLGFNAFVNFGRILTAAGMDGGKRPAKYAGDMIGMIGDSFNPFGSSDSLAQTLAPSVADPFVATAMNKDAFGRPIYREDRANKPTPGYLRSSEGASTLSMTISKILNQLSGGTEFQKGHISPTADEIDYLAGQFGGGTYREAKKVGEFVKAKAEGEEVAPYKVPLAGRFMGDTGSDANARSTFYQNVTQLSKYEDEIKGRAKNHQDVQAFLKEHPEARLYSTANSVENEIIQMNKLRKEMIARGATQDQLKRLNEMKIQRMRQFNELVKKATPQ